MHGVSHRNRLISFFRLNVQRKNSKIDFTNYHYVWMEIFVTDCTYEQRSNKHKSGPILIINRNDEKSEYKLKHSIIRPLNRQSALKLTLLHRYCH